jgi:hypothetical protein
MSYAPNDPLAQLGQPDVEGFKRYDPISILHGDSSKMLPSALASIDDAHGFGGQNDYPTIEELRSSIHEQRPDPVFEIEEYIIRVQPPLGSSDSTSRGQS